MSVRFIQFTVKNREFQMTTLQPFAAVTHSLKLKTILEKGFSDGLDSNVISVLSTIDEKTLETIIFPILQASQLTCTSEEHRLQSANDFNEIYSIDDMDEFFVAVWEVLKNNFGPFFQKMASRLFGVDLSQVDLEKLKASVKNLMATVKKENDKLTSDQTSSQSGSSGA